MMQILQNLAATIHWQIPRADPDSVLTGLLAGAFFMLGLVSVGFIIYGGIKFQLSRGSASEMVKARSIMLYAIIGLVVGLSAWAIIRFVIGNL